jgi:protein farnesyltransferase/geranylgeranyltransferase type-1 subunit alpha
LEEIFASDPKNYHAWSYRLWLVERFQLWAGELDFIEEMLDDDVTNNSVWSYRYFIIMKTAKTFSSELVNSEIEYIIHRRLRQNLLNESVWVYARGLLATSKEEVKQSQSTNTKKAFILEFP